MDAAARAARGARASAPFRAYFDSAARAERIAEEALAGVRRDGARCDACQLGGCGQGPVAAAVPRELPRLVIVAEAPGSTEVERGVPLVGRSGHVLSHWLFTGAGLDREQVYKTNAALCKPPGDMHLGDWRKRVDILERRSRRADEPNPAGELLDPREACEPRLGAELARLAQVYDEHPDGPRAARIVLTLGALAFRSVCSIMGVEDAPALAEAWGATFRGTGAWASWTIVAGYHPAYAMRSPTWFAVARDCVYRAGRMATGHVSGPHFARVKDGWELHAATVEWVEPPFLTGVRPFEEYVNWMDEARAAGWEVASDIETGGDEKGRGAVDPKQNWLRCLGLAHTRSPRIGQDDAGPTGMDREQVAVIPVAGMDGARHYPAWQEEQIRRAFSALHDAPGVGIIGQNYNFDFQTLLEKGWVTDRDKVTDDLLLLHRTTVDNDLRHSLSFIARRVFTMPTWKGFPHKSRDPGLNETLWTYNARDCLTTARCAPWLREWVRLSCNQAAYAVDRQLNGIARQVSKDIGVWVDEHVRGKYSQAVNDNCALHRAEFQRLTKAMVGREVNPGSSAQLIDLFYGTGPGEWGLEPLIGTDNREYDEVASEPGTSDNALKALVRQGLAPAQMEVMRHLAQYRKWDKLRGTYIDGIPTTQATPDELAGLPAEFPRTAGRVEGELHHRDDPETGEYKHGLPERTGLSRVYPIYKIYGPPTGRWACDNPALQTIPSRGRLNVKKMYRAAPGHVLVGADWDQLELRLACIASRDEVLREAILSGKDPHASNAAAFAVMTKPGTTVDQWYDWIADPASDWTRVASPKEQQLEAAAAGSGHKQFRGRWRNLAKRMYFAITYGARGPKLFEMLRNDVDLDGNLVFPDITYPDVLASEESWHTIHPATRRWHDEVKWQVEEHGFVQTTVLDRRRRWFLWNGEKDAAASINFGIQCAGGSLANECTLELVRRIPFGLWSPHTGMAWQVHDCLVWQVPEERAEETRAILEEVMTRNIDGIPITATAEVSVYYDGI
jgi:DNA polymerase I-like protein with 3'-5' exonuclease and polymerase domains/uracil-DNA glycosylase